MANYELDIPFSTTMRKLDPKEPNHADTAFNPHFKQLVNNDNSMNARLTDAENGLVSHKHTKAQITDFPSSLPADGGTAATCSGNAATATKLATARSIALTGDVTGSATFDGSSNVSITATVDSTKHVHTKAQIT
ncbi:hypothetical protein, partial [Pelosinus baikalensis]